MKSANFSLEKLEIEIEELKTIEEAEEFVRSYPLSLKEKIKILNENETINKLRDDYKYSSHKKKFKKVFEKFH